MAKLTVITLLLIVILGAVLRLYQFTTNPPGLYVDETSIAYNAYSINMTGQDEWGDTEPLLFKSFGDYKLPLFIYMVALSERLFGLTTFAVRFPSALAGILTLVATFFAAAELARLIKNKYPHNRLVANPYLLASLSAFLVAISPWHLQFSRAGFEANIALTFHCFGTMFFLLAVRKNIWLLVPALLCFVGSVYTYHSAAVSAPLILGTLIVLFYKQLLLNWKKVAVAFIVASIAVLPYLPSYVLSAHGRVRFNTESVLHMPGNPAQNFINNYVANFSGDFLFFKGDQDGRHSVKKIGELYLWQFPAVLAGLYFLIKYRSKTSVILIVWLLVAALPPSLTRVSPHALRGLLGVLAWQKVSALGAIFLLLFLRRRLRFLVIPVVLYFFALYVHLYHVHYPVAYAADWQDGQKQTIDYLKTVEKNYDQIFIMRDLYPVYLLWYLPYDPVKLHQSNHNTDRLGKYTYTPIGLDPKRDNPEKKSLLVAPGWMGSDKLRLLREIKNAGNDTVLRIYEL